MIDFYDDEGDIDPKRGCLIVIILYASVIIVTAILTITLKYCH